MSPSPRELARVLDDLIWSDEVDPPAAEPGLRLFLPGLGTPLAAVLAELSDESLAQTYRRALFRHEVFEELFVNRYERLLRGWFYKRTQNRDSMQELIQEFYVKLLTANTLAAYNPEYPFRPWFWQVVHHFWVSELRRRPKGREVGSALLAAEPAHEVGPVEEVLTQELQQRLDETISSLPEDEQQVVIRSGNGEKVSLIADAMGVPISRVYQLHFRARRAIERRLGLI